MKALGSLLLLLLVASPLCADETFKNYIARVNGDSVRLRSGPSLQHQPMHVLANGEELTVVGEQDGFALVRLPVAAPCWIAADLVALSGATYTVSGDRVNLRCTADTRFLPIGQVSRGTVLNAVLDGQTGKPAAENGFAKVAPPPEARGAVSLEFLQRVRDAEPETPKPVVEQPATPAPVEPTPRAPRTERTGEPTAEELDDERLAYLEIERSLHEELKKPAAEVNLTGIRKLFEQFQKTALAPKIRESAGKHIERIDTTVKMIDEELKRVADENARRQAELDRLREEALKPKEEPVEEQPKGPVEYLVIGTVGSTGKSARTPASHRLFDAEGKVLYDLRWDKGNLALLMGSKVGIVGEVREYEGWPNKVVVITRIDVISDEEEK